MAAGPRGDCPQETEEVRRTRTGDGGGQEVLLTRSGRPSAAPGRARRSATASRADTTAVCIGRSPCSAPRHARGRVSSRLPVSPTVCGVPPLATCGAASAAVRPVVLRTGSRSSEGNRAADALGAAVGRPGRAMRCADASRSMSIAVCIRRSHCSAAREAQRVSSASPDLCTPVVLVRNDGRNGEVERGLLTRSGRPPAGRVER